MTLERAVSPRFPPQALEFRVRYSETDQMGIVYHANYLVWCEIGRTEFIRTLGVSYADMERAGVSLAVSDLSVRYHAAARYDNMVRVQTTLSEVRSRMMTFDYQCSNAESGQRFATARTTLVSLDRSGRPLSLPPELRLLFAPPA
jgi:acyl-CoA thioester hydrolase